MKTKTLFYLAIVVIALFFTSCCKKNGKPWKAEPPYPGLEIQMQKFTVNADRDTVLVLQNGTSLSIPAKTMLGSNGEPIAGTYDLHYREFHDAIDIMLSGIPMEFYSMGQKRTMQTAGMFEIDAMQGDKKLKIDEGKNIGVRFASRYPGTNYNFFYMNPDGGKWEWVDVPEFEDNQLKKDAQLALDAKAPKIFLGDKYFVINYYRFLDIYLNDDYQKIYEKKNDIALKRKLSEYNFKLYNSYVDGEIVFLKSYYHPAEMLWKDIDGNGFPSWTENFEIDWQKDDKGNWYIANFSFTNLGNNLYQATYKKGRRSFIKKMEAVMPLKSILKLSASQWQQKFDEAMQSLKAEQETVDLMAESYRSFSINRLGTYNFDCLLKGLDEWTKINASFTLNASPAPEGNVILLLGDKSGYVTVKPSEYRSMQINPKSGHRILMILPDQQLGIYPAELLKSINADSLKALANPEFTFKMESKKVTDAIAFREMLGFK